jgi:hypothetical protein
MPDPFPQDHFIRQLIGVRSFRNGGMGINGQPDKYCRADDRSPYKKVPCALFPHKKPPFFSPLLWIGLFTTIRIALNQEKIIDLSQNIFLDFTINLKKYLLNFFKGMINYKLTDLSYEGRVLEWVLVKNLFSFYFFL